MAGAAQTVLARGGRGFLIGCGVGLLLAAGAAVSGFAPAGLTTPLGFVLAALAGGVVCTAGVIVAGSPVGACAGLAAGALLGASMSDAVGGSANRFVGATADIRGTTLTGQPFDIADWRGQVVLVDFWATWCPPCRKELPHVRALRDRFADQGFRVVGVSLDDSRDELQDFVHTHHLDWPNLFFGRDPNPLVQRYQVKGIPHTLLVDRDGTIAAAGLFGSEIDDAIEKLVSSNKDSLAGGRLLPAPSEPLVPFFGVAGLLAGLLIERRLKAGTR